MSVRYLVVALLVRIADSGAVVALLVVAAVEHISLRTGGILIALLTLPHLLGPMLAQPLARALVTCPRSARGWTRSPRAWCSRRMLRQTG